MSDGAKPQLRRFTPSMEALGVIVSFLCRTRPYADFRAATLVSAVSNQLAAGTHVALIADERLVAYGGWMQIAMADGEAWLRDAGELRPRPAAESDAVALTTVCMTGPHLDQLIRAMRQAAPRSIIYFKRDYGNGRSRKMRLREFRR